jgi:3-oxoacyl-[acyl-carrier protein] reductase
VVSTGRAVLVTGASGGIGREIAGRFAADGHRVAVHYATARETAEQLVAGLPGDGHLALAADLSDPDAARGLVDTAAARLGGLDVVVNNAAVYVEQRVTEVGFDEWRSGWERVVGVNLLAPAWTCWAAVRHLPHGGRIINVSSRGAYRGEPRHPSYGATKAALNSLTQSLAVALAPSGILVAAVAPGYVSTGMANWETMPDGERARIEGQSPFGRVARADEVAEVVCWLASTGAEFVSGTVVDVNGASYLR